MRSRKIYKIYAALADDDRAAFGRYLDSPYFNMSQRLIDFRKGLEMIMTQQLDQGIDSETFWKSLPGVTTAYRANGFDKLCSEALNALNDFLAMQTIRSHPATMASHQLQAYLDRNLDDFIPGLYDAIVSKLADDLSFDTSGLHASHRIAHLFGQHLFRVNPIPPGEHLLEIDHRLNLYYFASKLELAGAIDAYQEGFNGSLVMSEMDAVVRFFESMPEDLPILLKGHGLAWTMLRKQDSAQYFRLKKLLDDQGDQLPITDQKALFQMALNFCVGQLNLENESFEEELDQLQLRLLEKGLILIDGKLTPQHFKNIVQVRLRLGHLDWVRGFLEQWGQQLNDNHGGCALIYNQAILDFYDGNFSSCLRDMEIVLRDFKTDMHYGSDARHYSLMCIFELNKKDDWSQELEARLGAFRLYLIRDKNMGEVKKQRLLNLVKQFRRLISLQNETKARRIKRIPKVLEGLKSLKPASNRKWFERQVLAIQDANNY